MPTETMRQHATVSFDPITLGQTLGSAAGTLTRELLRESQRGTLAHRALQEAEARHLVTQAEGKHLAKLVDLIADARASHRPVAKDARKLCDQLLAQGAGPVASAIASATANAAAAIHDGGGATPQDIGDAAALGGGLGGALGGVVIGGIVGGLPGAIVGGLIGFAAGATAGAVAGSTSSQPSHPTGPPTQ